MKRCNPVGLGALLAVLFAAPPWAAATTLPPLAHWAVLVEFDTYDGRYPDLPAGYVNSTRILDALIRRGWPPDHILLIRDSADWTVLNRATGWLAEHVRPGDVALLYVAGEYQFFDKELRWKAALPNLWRRVPTPRRVLIVETCFAERLTAAVGGIPGLALPAVGRDELDWWGLRETGRLIRGATFSYFLARALEQQPVDTPPDFAAAFAAAVAGSRDYFRTVIAAAPPALAAYHARGSYPERLAVFPNPRLAQDGGSPTAP